MRIQEKELAEFIHKDDTLCFSTGFSVNQGVLAQVVGKGDYIICDDRDHASIVDGRRLSFARQLHYKHNDMEDLERVLKALPEDAIKLIVVDGVFSMEGVRGKKRIVVEKPFGYNLDSALELNNVYYKDAFREDQIFRIDHYLGKETVQNIMALRFANSIFEPVWNRNYIDHIEITAVENMGVEQRGGYVDEIGTLRDMVQNHLIQLVAITAMEPPMAFNADSFRDEVAKVYQSLTPLTEKDMHEHIVRGQYVASENKKGIVTGKQIGRAHV